MSLPSRQSILRITEEKTIEFLDLYEKEECLWNTALEDYKNTALRKEANKRIAKALDIKHFTHHHVMFKFKNLRNSYCQELKKISNSIKSGKDPVYRPKLFWFAKMDGFLRPHVYATKGTKMKDKKLSLNTSTASETDNLNFIIIQPNSEYDEAVKDENNGSFSIEEYNLEEEPPRKRTKNKSARKLVLDNNSESYISDHFEVTQPGVALNNDPLDNRDKQDANSKHLEDIVKCLSNLSKNTQRDDCFDTFGKYVAAMLRNMSKRRALEVQPEIVKLLVSGTLGSELQVSQSDQSVCEYLAK